MLTRDGVPVLSHDPWVHKTLCTRVDGVEVGQALIRDIDFADLIENYRCGGVTDAEFPDVTPVAEPIMGLDEFLEVLAPAPDLIVYLDLKVEEQLTAPPQDYAVAISRRWERHGMTNPLYVELPDAQTLAAFRRSATIAFTSVVSYPPFYAGENWTKVGLTAAAKTRMKSETPSLVGEGANADAVASPTQVMTRRAIEILRAAGRQAIVFAPKGRESLDDFCRKGAAILITDEPHLGPCD